MFQYFLKVVSTQFEFLDGRELKTHQYSVTQYERDCMFLPLCFSFSPTTETSVLRRLGSSAVSNKNGPNSKDNHGHQTTHGYAGVPGYLEPLLALTSGSTSLMYCVRSLSQVVLQLRDLAFESHPRRNSTIVCTFPHFDVCDHWWSIDDRGVDRWVRVRWKEQDQEWCTEFGGRECQNWVGIRECEWENVVREERKGTNEVDSLHFDVEGIISDGHFWIRKGGVSSRARREKTSEQIDGLGSFRSDRPCHAIGDSCTIT